MPAGALEEAADDRHATASASVGSDLALRLSLADRGLLAPGCSVLPIPRCPLVGDTVLGHSDEVAPGDLRWGAGG